MKLNYAAKQTPHPALSPSDGERESSLPPARNHDWVTSCDRTLLPLPVGRGEGRGEGQR